MRINIGALKQYTLKSGTVILDATVGDDLCSIEIAVDKDGEIIAVSFITGQAYVKENFEIWYSHEAVGKKIVLERLEDVRIQMNDIICERADGWRYVKTKKVEAEELADFARKRIASVLTAVVDREMGV